MKVLQLFQNIKSKAALTKVALGLLMTLLFVVHIFGDFRGMSSPEAMESASLGREILRGNGLNSKVIQPQTIAKSLDNGKPLKLTEHVNTHTAPAYPFVNAAFLALFGGADYDAYRIAPGHYVYALDRVLASAALLFMFISIGVNYLLFSKMFDKKLATTVALIMLLSTTMWEYVQSCLPQMFLLMLFSLILLMLYKAHLIYQQQNRTAWSHLAVCAVLFGLMAITKWMTLWLFVGYLAVVLIHFKPKGMVALLSLGIVALLIAPVAYMNLQNYGNPIGLAGITIANSVAISEEYVLRNFDRTYIKIDGLVLHVANLVIQQLLGLTKYLGGIIVAPLFFLSLLHTYRRETITHFKWALFLMLIPAIIGMSIFSGKELSQAHQLHILFAPGITALGISVVSTFWAKLSVSRSNSLVSNGHLVVILACCAGPLLIGLPKQVVETFENKGKGRPNAPYYQTAEFTNELNRAIFSSLKAGAQPVVYSDQPEALAWYTDVHSIGIPTQPKHFDKIDAFAEAQGVTISGIHTSAASVTDAYSNPTYAAVAPLVYTSVRNQLTGMATSPALSSLTQYTTNKARWKNLAESYPHAQFIKSSNRVEFKDYGLHIYHSRLKVDSTENPDKNTTTDE